MSISSAVASVHGSPFPADLASVSTRIAPRTDLGHLAARFSAERAVLVPDLLDTGFASHLHERMSSWTEWTLVTRIDGRHRGFDARAMETIAAEKRAAFDELVAAEARIGLQYLYERFPLYDHGRARRLVDPILIQAYAVLRSDPFLDLGRRITGVACIRFADGQLTRYRRGHFLTLHDDHADGLNRVAAFVLNLTPRWAADFGGQLQLVDRHGQIEKAIVPGFNVLTVFSVPRPHLVSAVAPFVADARMAVTGWFRAGDEPA